MKHIKSIALFVAIFVVGLVVSPVVGGVFLGGGTGPNTVAVDPANPPMSVSTAQGCADQHTRNASGWLAETTTSDGISLTFNQTYAGDSGATVRLKSSPATQTYILVVTTGEKADSGKNTEKQGGPPTDCTPATSVQSAVTLPQNYSTFTVVHNGETVVEAHNTHETTTRVWKLSGQPTTR